MNEGNGNGEQDVSTSIKGDGDVMIHMKLDQNECLDIRCSE